MSLNPESQNEILDLVWALVNDRLDPGSAARLEELVTGDAASRRAYLAAMDLFAGLEWGEGQEHHPKLPTSDIQSPFAESFDDQDSLTRPGAVGASPVLSLAGRTSNALTRSPSRAILFVATVYYTVAAVLFWSLTLGSDSSGPARDAIAVEGIGGDRPFAESQPRQNVERSLATLVGAQDIRWDSPQVPTRIGADLPSGELSLLDGMAEILFANGARLSLQGPARLELLSADAGRLAAGKIEVHVPPKAVGFKIQTPTAEIIDLGTEFGVVVTDDGTTDVTVFRGKVEVATATEVAIASSKRTLTTGQRQRLTASGYVGDVAMDPTATPSILRRISAAAGPVIAEQGGTFGPGNLATLSSAKAFALDCLASHPAHKIEHLNDGLYGNGRSWIAESGKPPFAGISLGGKFTIDGIAFGRDNGQGSEQELAEPFRDRCAGTYILQVTTVESPDAQTPDADWRTLGTITHGDAEVEIASGLFKPYLRHRYAFAPVEATGVRLQVPAKGIAIDELEVYEAKLVLPQEK